MLNVKKLLTKMLNNTPEIRKGQSALGSVPANSYTDTAITFDSEMRGEPIVLVSLYTTSTSPTMGSFTVTPINVSKTGFTCRCFNDTSSARSPGVRYVAFYRGGR